MSNIKPGKFVRFKKEVSLKALPSHQKIIFKVVLINETGTCFGEDPETEYGNIEFLELWEPQSTELCWFYNSKKKMKATLGMFRTRDSFFTKHNYISFDSNKIYNHCEPYIVGKLPIPLEKTKDLVDGYFPLKGKKINKVSKD